MMNLRLRVVVTPLLIALFVSAACSTAGGGTTRGTATPPPAVTITPPVNANHTATIPIGATAITPTQAGAPAYTESDVRAYLQQHPMMPGAQSNGPFTVASVAFMPSREASALLAGESMGYPDATVVCIVLVQGLFAFPRPPDASATYQKGFLVYDAISGNLVMNGGLHTTGTVGALALANSSASLIHTAAQALTRPALPLSSYSCTSTHCYALAQWQGAGLTIFLDGMSTDITFTAKVGGDGFLDTEMWLVQKNNPACNDVLNGTGPQCWVETGMLADATRGFPTVTHYFWADNRPNAAFAFHDMGPVGSLDQNTQTPDGFFITSDGPNTWQIGIVGLQTNSALIFAYSINNPMVPNLIEYGSELYGTNGAGMVGNARFSDLIYYSGEFGLYIKANPTNTFADSPQFFNFTETPASSSTGGVFETHCC